MNKTFLVLIWIAFSQASWAQNTWVQRFPRYPPTIPIWDTVAGVINIVEGADGGIYSIGRVNHGPDDYIFGPCGPGFSSGTWPVGGPSSGVSYSKSRFLLATPDSGCRVGGYSEFVSNPNIGIVRTGLSKFDKLGIWHYMPIVCSSFQKFPKDVVSSPNGGFYILFSDSMLEVDTTNLVIFQTAIIHGRKFFSLPAGDFIVYDDVAGTLKRINLSGATAWSVPCLSSLLTFNQGCILGIDNLSMFKIDAINGNTTWSYPRPFPNISCIDKTPQGGFVASCGVILDSTPAAYMPGTLFEVDSSGNVLWSESYSFPDFGLNRVVKLSDGRLATGGSYRHTNYGGFGMWQYTAFLAVVDSVGQGRLNTTSYTWPGDANFNDTVSFLDDALYVGLAMGFTGPERDYSPPYWDQGWVSSFAADWPTTFSGGLNHKHADCNGDGVITSADYDLYTNFANQAYGNGRPPILIIPSWRLSSTSGIGDLLLVPEHDSVTAGDNIRFYLVAGTPGALIDSIYGIALKATLDTSLLSTSPAMTLYNSDFGNPATNLMAYDFVSNVDLGFPNYRTDYFAIVTRTDHQNALALGDTIAEINMVSDATIATTTPLNFTITGHRGITFSESDVMMSGYSASVVITPAPVGIQDPSKLSIHLFPNPAKNSIRITCGEPGTVEVTILDMKGRILIQQQSRTLQSGSEISLAGISSGVYFVEVRKGDAVTRLRFVKD